MKARLMKYSGAILLLMLFSMDALAATDLSFDRYAVKIGILVLSIAILALFVSSVYKTTMLIPAAHRPRWPWLMWLLLIPKAGIVFDYIMIAFAVPNALKATAKEREDKAMLKQAKLLFVLGLGAVILITIALAVDYYIVTTWRHFMAGGVTWDGEQLDRFYYITQFSIGVKLVASILRITYWFKIVSIRKKFLLSEDKNPEVKA